MTTELDLHAYLDESKKPVRDPSSGRVSGSGYHYAVGAAVVLRGDAQRVREEVRGVAERLDCNLHFSDLSRRLKQEVMSAVGGIDGWEGIVYETRAPVPNRIPERRSRARLLHAAFPDLVATLDVHVVTLETRAAPHKGFEELDRQDHSTWQSLIAKGVLPQGRVLMHRGKDEPLLWIADLLAGARTDDLCAVDRSAFSVIAHRVSRVVRIDG